MRSGGAVGQVSAQLESTINENAGQGWEFYSLDNVDIEIRPGCLASLFGARVSYITFNQIIFRRAAE
jgi:hypothetical protein